MRREFSMKYVIVILALAYSTSINANSIANRLNSTLATEMKTESDDQFLDSERNNAANSNENIPEVSNSSDADTDMLNPTVLPESEDQETTDKPDHPKSIAFVVDTTIIYLDNIKSEISKEFGKFDNSTDYNYSLIQFNETDVAPIIRNGSLDSFSEALKVLESSSQESNCHGRQSLRGIQESLNGSLSDSFIIVFTKGNPVQTDSELLSPILSTVAEKRIRVYFIVVDLCVSNKISKEYFKIAAVSNGQIIEAKASDQIGKLLNVLTNSTRVDLLAIDKPREGSTESYEVFVDETMTDMLILIYSGQIYRLRVFDPSNEEFKESRSSGDLALNFSYVRGYRVQKPKSGKWKITVENAKALYSLRVSAASDMKISFGFDQLESPVTNLTFCQPFLDKTNIFFVNSHKLSLNASVSSTEIISMDGKGIQQSINMNRVRNTRNLFSGQFNFPNESDLTFHLQINGTINGNSTFQRITPVGFRNHSSNQKNKLRNCILPHISYEVPPTTPGYSTSTETPDTTAMPNNSTTRPKVQETQSKATIILSISGIVLVVILLIVGLVIYCRPRATYQVPQSFDRNGCSAFEK